MSSIPSRHQLLTPADLRREFEAKRSRMSDIERVLIRPQRSLKRVPVIKGDPKKRSFRRVFYYDINPFIWSLKFKQEMLFNTQTSEYQTMNSELFFIHDAENMCNMTYWGDKTRDYSRMVENGEREIVISVTKPAVTVDEEGVFHCARCLRPMGKLNELVVGRDTKNHATIVFNPGTSAIEDPVERRNATYAKYIDIIDPLLDFEADRFITRAKDDQAQRDKRAIPMETEEDIKNLFEKIGISKD